MLPTHWTPVTWNFFFYNLFNTTSCNDDILGRFCKRINIHTWWRHQMETFSGLLCWEFTGHRGIPLTKASDAELWCFLWFDLRLNKRLSKQSQGCWFETPSRSLWRHRNEISWKLRGIRGFVQGVTSCGCRPTRKRVIRYMIFIFENDNVIHANSKEFNVWSYGVVALDQYCYRSRLFPDGTKPLSEIDV